MDKKVSTKDDIIKRILEEREQIAFFGIASIGVFGSFVRGNQTSLSDIDILRDSTLKRAFV